MRGYEVRPPFELDDATIADWQPILERIKVANFALIVQYEVAALPLELILGCGRVLLPIHLGELELARQQLDAKALEIEVVVIVVGVDALVVVHVRSSKCAWQRLRISVRGFWQQQVAQQSRMRLGTGGE